MVTRRKRGNRAKEIANKSICIGSKRVTLNVFTLVELLVVISIIVILASMLLPALQKMHEKGKSISCTNQMKQFMTCLFSYAIDYGDYLVPVAILTQPEGNNRYYDFMYPYAPSMFTARKKSGLYNGEGNIAAPYCPSYIWGTLNSKAIEIVSSMYGGYAINMEASGYNNGTDWIYSGRRVASYRNSSSLPYFLEMNWYVVYSGRWPNWVLYNHLKKTNVAFLDGHVSSYGRSTPASEFSWSP